MVVFVTHASSCPESPHVDLLLGKITEPLIACGFAGNSDWITCGMHHERCNIVWNERESVQHL